MADFAACCARSFTSWMLMTGARVSVGTGSLEVKATCRCHCHESRVLSSVGLCTVQLEKCFSG